MRKEKLMKDIKQIIANNLVSLRKQNKLTQNELASKLNYSDNTISRWEKAEITPSIETLVQISEIYKVPLESLLKENITKQVENNNRVFKLKKLATILLCVSLVWFAAIISFFYLETFFNKNMWTLFIWSVPLSCIILLAFNKYVNSRAYSFCFSTIFIWSTITSIYLELLQYNMFLIFLIGIPAQVALVIYTFIRPKEIKNK